MRISIIRTLFLLLFAAILIRLLYWQVIQAEKLQAFAEKQHIQDVKLRAMRGDILFSDSAILASSQPIFNLYALPKVLSNKQKEELAIKLSEVLYDDKNDILEFKSLVLERLSQDLYWVSLKKDLDLETKKVLESLKLSGIGFEVGSGRFYPEGSSSAHLLGFVGSNAKGENSGYFGLEGFYDGELKGLPGLRRFEKDAFGLPILIGNFLSQEAINGKSLVLNVDRIVQFILEKYLKMGMDKYGAKGASGIIMDPKTGAILGMASFPNYDPLEFNIFPKEYYKNPIVADSYEPGSTFKVLVMAAALNEDLIKPDTKCDICSGPISLGGFSLRTWNNKYYPETNMTDVIVHSDNTGMVFIAQKLGIEKIYRYIVSYGFGEFTNIDLQDEFTPDIRPQKEWREIDLATSSFGQGIAVTPIQMITAVSSIANKGVLMEPHVVKKVVDDNYAYEIKPKVVRQVISDQAAELITEMMVKAVDEGESKWAKPRGFKVAGKTGTAQIPVAGHYDPDKTIASFVGFAPANNPKFVMLIKYDQPSSSIFGSETAAPTFFEIAKELFTYFEIAPAD